MYTQSFNAALVAALLAVATPTWGQQANISAKEAQDIAVEAYIYFYPLVTMDITRKQLSNLEPGKVPGRGPMNMFNNIPTYPPADEKAVVRPNFDTLYSTAWLDLTNGPVVVTVPDTDGRFYLLPMLDMWSDVFASPGWRTTGTKAGHFLIAPQDWQPSLKGQFIEEFKLPEGTQLIEAPTPYVWIIGRTKTDGPSDYAAVNKIQAGYQITPLSQWGKQSQNPTVKIDPTVDMKTPPKEQVDTMPGEKYFTYSAELMKMHPPHVTDQPIMARMARIGILRGRSLDTSKLDPTVRRAISEAPALAQKQMAEKLPTLARVVNYWQMNTDTMGVYGNYYLKRALVAQVGLGANLPEDAIYPINLADESGKPLDGNNKYTLRFEKGATPPAGAFWSITLYDLDGFQVANSLNRFAVSSWMPFKSDSDGSLTLYFQNESPGADMEANWLPAPKGPFSLTMRLYSPMTQALTGAWNPPPVKRQ